MTASEKWQNHIRNQQESGLSQAAYCRQHNLHPVSFSQWKRRLQEGVHDTRFVALELPETLPQSLSGNTFRLLLDNGIELVFPTAIDHMKLASIVSALRML